MRICTLDIETTDLSAVGAGWIVCACIKPLGEAVRTLRFDRLGCAYAHENKLIAGVFEALGEHDLVVGHNLEQFDWMYLKSRALILGVPLPRPPMAYDTMKAARRVGLRTAINTFTGRGTVALDHVIDFFGLPQSKTKIYPRKHWASVWERDRKEGKRAIAALVEHCEADVEMTEAIYWKLIQHDPKPRVVRLS